MCVVGGPWISTSGLYPAQSCMAWLRRYSLAWVLSLVVYPLDIPTILSALPWASPALKQVILTEPIADPGSAPYPCQNHLQFAKFKNQRGLGVGPESPAQGSSPLLLHPPWTLPCLAHQPCSPFFLPFTSPLDPVPKGKELWFPLSLLEGPR